MQRIINNPNQVVEEMIKGFCKCHAPVISATNNPRVVKYVGAPIAGKVGIVTGGGSGHKPAFIGYVGKNMVDAVAIGEIFSSPTAKAFLDAFRAADSGNGVACLYGNYAGDNMNVKMAVKQAAKEGIEVRTVVANDDVASAGKEESENRRGVAGEILMWKIGGAKSAEGASLEEVIRVSEKAINNTKSVGVGLTSCTIPAVGHPNFEIEDGMMEVGIGHHGEPGIKVVPLENADTIADVMLDIILPDQPFESGDKVCVLISGLGATPIMEEYIIFNRVFDVLKNRNIDIYRSYVGNYFTSLDMMGVTLTLMKLDSELEQLLDVGVETMGLTQLG
jgi:dihydroxyacetone kinase-like protein